MVWRKKNWVKEEEERKRNLNGANLVKQEFDNGSDQDELSCRHDVICIISRH